MQCGLRAPLRRNEELTPHRVAPGTALINDLPGKTRRKESGVSC